jgi:hypothetical protein
MGNSFVSVPRKQRKKKSADYADGFTGLSILPVEKIAEQFRFRDVFLFHLREA